MMEWWVERGVDGFRVDAISYLDKRKISPDSHRSGAHGYSFLYSPAGRPSRHPRLYPGDEREKFFQSVT